MRQRGILEKNEGAGKRAEELRGQGYSLRDISDKLKSEFGVKITHNGVRDYFERKGEMTANYIRGNQELQDKVEEEVIDTLETMRNIRERMADLMDDWEETGSVQVSAANTLIKLLEFQEKKLGNIQQQSVQNQQNITNVYSYTDISVFMNKKLRELEKNGIITIHKTLPTEDMDEVMVEKQQ